MVGVSRLLVAFAVAGLLSQPLYADVIPTRRAADTTESSQKVESRLVQMGVSAEAWNEVLRDPGKAMPKMIARCESDTAGLMALYKRTRHLVRDLKR